MFGAGFNVEAYQRRLDELRIKIAEELEERGGAENAVWMRDVSLRYGRFLAQRTLEQFQRAVANFSGIDFVDDKQKHREHSAAELMGVVSGLHAASAMIRGQVLIADPVGAEAMMRIYEEANVRPGSVRDDNDDVFRQRIRGAAARAGVDGVGKDGPLLEMIETAIGADLDRIGQKYGVRRATLKTARSAPDTSNQAPHDG